jgi:hypothetical protein
MRIFSSSVKHHYSAAVVIFLIVAALMVGITACDGDTYQLTMSSASGGSVNTPGEGTFTYDAGNMVSLVATPDEGYRFHS